MLLSLLAFTYTAEAQDVLAPPPEVSVIPPALQQIQPSEMEVFPAVERVPNIQQGPPLQWGPVSLRPHLLYQFLYGDGIQSSPGQQEKTTINTISPGLLLGIGSHWSIDYTPTLTFYSNSAFHDTTAQNVIMTGGTAYENWVLGLSQSYNYSSQPLVETGGQTSQDEYKTAASASYQFSRQMSLELAVNQDFTFPSNFAESREWSTVDWLDYQFWPRFSAGIGVGFGYTDVSVGNDSIDGQLQCRIRWRATDKISLQISGGADDRHFFGGGTSDLINPLYSVSVQYQPFDETTISLSANGTVGTSYFTNQVTETKGVDVTLNQRLLKKLFLTLGGSYQNVSYTATTKGVSAGRNDDTYSFNARLSTAFLKRGTIAAIYQFSDNSSNQSGFGYTSNQVGLEVGYRY
jgi:Putative beta-barrel porin 2